MEVVPVQGAHEEQVCCVQRRNNGHGWQFVKFDDLEPGDIMRCCTPYGVPVPGSECQVDNRPGMYEEGRGQKGVYVRALA